MNIIKNNQIPHGFEIAYYNCDNTLDFDYALLVLNEEEYIFYIKDVIPKLPLKKITGIWSDQEWFNVIIDGDDKCWVRADSDDTDFHPISAEDLILKIKSEKEQNNLRKILGLEIPMPEWAQVAIKEGFLPPIGWTWKK